MFVKKVKSKSGKTYLQVIDKSSGKYRVLKNIGSSYSEREIKRLEEQAREWIDKKLGVLRFDFDDKEKKVEEFFESISGLKLVGLELLLGKIFDEIGFNKITDELFKQLVIYRLFYPASKLKTSEYLSRYAQIEYNENQIYRYLDKLYREQKEQIQQISYEHTREVLGDKIRVVFYDVTTLYFQIDNEDNLRIRGFSKEGKHQNPQIVLGLLVSIEGYPLAFEIFEGNKFEGHTMLPVLERFKKKYNLEKLVIVADSGLLSNKNIKELQERGYEFILGARIKNERREIKEKILSLSLRNGESKVIDKGDNIRLVISYSDGRARKDKHNRERGLKRLEKLLKSGKLTKSNLNKRGYNKYLRLEGKLSITIDYDKFKEDEQWDGLKGYITNTGLTKDEIIENYGELWKIEKAFRIAKHDLRIRPIYHRLQRRIEAHIIINFVAYKVYKELERQLKEKKAKISPERAIEIAENIYEIEVNVPHREKRMRKILILTDEQKYLAQLFGFRGVK